MSALLGVRQPLNTYEVSAPEKPPEGKNPPVVQFDGGYATITRYGSEGGPIAELWPLPHPSWRVRFGPMITGGTEANPGLLALPRLNASYFDDMSMSDWEVFARHLEKGSISTPLQVNIKQGHAMHMHRDISTLSYIVLMLRAAEADENVASLMSTRPSQIGRDLAKFRQSGLISESILMNTLCAIGGRHTNNIASIHIPEFCAGANIMYNWLSSEVASPRAMHKFVKISDLCAGLKALGQNIIRENIEAILNDDRDAEACGIAFGMAVAGTLIYVEEQARYGNKRNAYINLAANAAASVGLGCLGAFTGGISLAVTGVIVAINGVAGTVKGPLIEKGIGKAFKVYEWGPALRFFGDEMHTAIDARLPSISNLKVRKSVQAFLKGFKESRNSVETHFSLCEGAPGTSRLGASQFQQLRNVTSVTGPGMHQ
jgi:hypothetical protein